MTRPARLPGSPASLWVAALLIVASAGCSTSPVASPAGTRPSDAAPSVASTPPNVLFIGIDDLRPELGAYGVTDVHTPNIDALARRSMVFRRAYVQQAICGPSRVSLLTGLRPDGSGITQNIAKVRDFVPDIVTLPQHFLLNGYHSVNFGKIFHGHDGALNDTLSWSEPFYNAPQMYTNNIRGYLSYDNIRTLAEENAESESVRYHASFWEAEDVPDNAYPDGMVVEKAVDALYRLDDQQPFFLAVGIEKPHLPFACPKRYWDLYDRSAIRLPSNYHPTEGETPYTGANWEDFRHYTDSPSPETITDEEARLAIHGYRACVSYADALVGQLLDAVEARGLLDNTIVVLWGDHGFKLGEHFMWSKGTNYELDTLAPLLVAMPGGATVGLSTDRMVEFVDIYPSLAELAGLPLPDHLQGTSFAPLLRDPDRRWKRAVFSQFPRDGGSVMGYSMRTDRYRYTRWQDAGGAVLDRELYDHATDAAEDVNLASNPASRPTIDALDLLFEAEYDRAHTRGSKPLRTDVALSLE